MTLVLRIDLDYVPWDLYDSEIFGHGEPAMMLRLLALARSKGLKLHCFASWRSLRAFPTLVDAVLGEGHDLDWLCRDPQDSSEREAAAEQFGLSGHKPIGIGMRRAAPTGKHEWANAFQFISAPPPSALKEITLFPLNTRTDQDAVDSGMSLRALAAEIKTRLTAAQDRVITACFRPEVLGKHDPKLECVLQIISSANELSVPVATFRELVKADKPAG